MDEEELAGSSARGRGRGARPAGRPGGGLTLGAKAALLTGGVTFLVMALALLAANMGKGGGNSAMDEAGYVAAQALASTDPAWWTGEEATPEAEDLDNAWKPTHRAFVTLFGEAGKYWWEERVSFKDTKFTETEDWDESDKSDLREAKKLWTEGLEKLSGKKAKAGEGDKALKDMATSLRVVGKPAFNILGAWIRQVPNASSEGDIVASYPTPNSIAYDWTRWKRSTQRMPGKITRDGRTYDVTIYTGDMSRGGVTGKPLRAYVALWENPAVGGGSSKSAGLGILLAVLGPLLVGGIAYAIGSAHTKNVRSLAREIDKLGTTGDADRFMRAQGGDAAFVARAVERMVANLEFRSKHGDEDLDQIAEKERKVAEEIHASLIAKNPPRLSNWEVETLYKPGFEIAGDHFEYFPIDKTHLGVILLDTNVRGLPAALVMASARSYVRAAAPGQLSPAAVLKQVNKNLAGDLPPGRHVTALYVVIDTSEGKATLSSAGHLPLLVYRHATGKVAKVNPDGIALGLDRGPVFDKSLQEGDIPIGVGDRIVLYTDGALNIQDEYGEEFGETRFYESVTREAPKNSQAFVNFVGSAIDRFHLTTPQNDDVTISTVKRLK